MSGYMTPKRSRSYESNYNNKKTKRVYVRKVRYSKGKGASKFRDGKAKISETKVNDFQLSNSITYNTAAGPLMGIAQGQDNTNRIGRQIRVKGVNFCLKVSALASTLNAAPFLGGANTVRCAIVVDKNNSSGTAPTYSDVWITSGSNTVQSMMPRNMNNIDRFDVLYDERQVINAGGPLGALFKGYLKLDLKAVYGGTTGVQPFTNAIYLFVLDQNDGTGINYCGVMGNVRVTFFDD